MKAMIMAAGLGTRLKPWTLEHPKALFPVDGVPMLEHVIRKLKLNGFDEITINVHHFSSQIIEFLGSQDFGLSVNVSDESEKLLDTGGGVLHAGTYFHIEDGPVLVHNVDILSNADLQGLMRRHEEDSSDVTLLVSDRHSSRKLIFDAEMQLKGWHDLRNGQYRMRDEGTLGDPYVYKEYGFSGIYVIGERVISEMKRIQKNEEFPIMDFFLNPENECKISGFEQTGLILKDIGHN